jgi:hypothetical protein
VVAAAVREGGGEVPFEGRYADTQADFRDLIRQLKRISDFGGEKSSVRDIAKPKRGTPFPVPCDAIFLAGDYRQAILLASQLRFHDVHVPIIGNNSWVSGDLQHFPEAALVGAVFVDSFSPEAPDATARNFVAAYRKAKPSVPSAFAAQAYDATAAVIDAIRNGAKSPSEVHAHLWHADDLPGLAGPMHFDSDGLLQRPATLNKVKGGGKIEFLRRVRPSAATPSVVSAR